MHSLCTNSSTPYQRKLKKRNGLIFYYSQIQNNQNWHSVISIHLETKCAHICASTTYFIPVLWIHNALSSWNLSLSLSLVFLSSFEASVLRHLWGTFLGMFFFFFFFLIGLEKSVCMGRNSFATLHQIIWGHLQDIAKPKKEGDTSIPFRIQIVLVCMLLIWSSNQNSMCKNRKWFMVCNYIPENCTCKNGCFQCWISETRFWVWDFGSSGGVQLHAWTSHTRKWVVVVLYWWNPFSRVPVKKK